MKIKDIAYSILVGTFCGYLGTLLQKRIKKHLEKPVRPTPDLRGGNLDRIGFWSKLLEKHQNNLPYVTGILGVVASLATVQYNEQLANFLCSTTFSSIYEKAKSENLYIIALQERQSINKFVAARNLLKAYELTPKLTYSQKMSGYKLIIRDLLSCDTKWKLFYNIAGLVSLFLFLYTGNILMFTNMMCALIQLINEGKISRAVAKALVFLLRKEGLPIPKELEDVISE